MLSENINYVSYFIGAAFACKKSIFDKRITFDELFFWGNEELDFSYNLIKNEYKLMFHPAFKANHYPGRSVIDKNDKKIFIAEEEDNVNFEFYLSDIDNICK